MINIDTSKSVEENLEEVRNNLLVIDIETSAFYPGTLKPINIKSNFTQYVDHAEVKWIGLYSYRTKKYYYANCNDSLAAIFNLIASHKILVGFNLEDFDIPILMNNGYIDPEDNHVIVDCMTILGHSSYKTKKGFPFKNRGVLMGYDFVNNSMRTMAEAMELETQKGEIDYTIFEKMAWDELETEEILKYLSGDIKTNKEMFDMLWDYWYPFVQFLPDKHKYDLSWIKGSIASMIYKSCCNILDMPVEYADKSKDKKEEMGGNVILPVMEEARKVWYVDFASLYPHIMTIFNLFSEVPEETVGKYIWHGNDVFQVKGYYDVSAPHTLSLTVRDFLKKRTELKKTDPDNPMIYTYKIFLNGLYGVIRSAIFKNVHQPNAGWDTCWLGQQCQKILIDTMADAGFQTIMGDTDSIFIIADKEEHNNAEYVREHLVKTVEKIFDNAPFKVDTFKVDIECYIDYLMAPFSEQPIVGEDGKNIKVKNRLVKELKGKKKNYLYITKDKEGKNKIKIKGLPIKKSNATKMGLDIFHATLEKKILDSMCAKFDKEFIDSLITEYLNKPDAFDIISTEYKVKPANSYKKENQIQGQISRAYFGGGDGVIRLIKNSMIGKVGKGKKKYCSIEEAREHQLSIDNIDLTKVYNELDPFIKH